MENNKRLYHKIDGNIVILGFGGIGRGILPLILRHFDCSPNQITVIDQSDTHKDFALSYGVHFQTITLTPKNYTSILSPLLGVQGSFLVNVSIGIASRDLISLTQKLSALYIDTFIEAWPDPSANTDLSTTGNHFLREDLLEYASQTPYNTTAVTCCGANPGLVSWLAKQALLNLSQDLGTFEAYPQTQKDWAHLMHKTGVTGLHICERDSQRAKTPRAEGTFVNTWSVEGLIYEGLFQPAEFGWGTHEQSKPHDWHQYNFGSPVAVYLNNPGAITKVRTWLPGAGAQWGYLIAHNETITIPEYFTLNDGDALTYTPTCHYAYRPCDDAVASFKEMHKKGWHTPMEHVLLEANDIQSGANELGVLLYGHEKNAYWFGSTLTIDQARAATPNQNATALQVTGALLAGMVWAIENPECGIVEPEDMDHARCLEIQTPYLGTLHGVYSCWTPLSEQQEIANDHPAHEDPWQFVNTLIKKTAIS